MKFLLRLLKKPEKSSIRRRLRLLESKQRSQTKWVILLEQKVRLLKNYTRWPKNINTTPSKHSEYHCNEEDVIRINKSIIDPRFLENKN